MFWTEAWDAPRRSSERRPPRLPPPARLRGLPQPLRRRSPVHARALPPVPGGGRRHARVRGGRCAEWFTRLLRARVVTEPRRSARGSSQARQGAPSKGRGERAGTAGRGGGGTIDALAEEAAAWERRWTRGGRRRRRPASQTRRRRSGTWETGRAQGGVRGEERAREERGTQAGMPAVARARGSAEEGGGGQESAHPVRSRNLCSAMRIQSLKSDAHALHAIHC